MRFNPQISCLGFVRSKGKYCSKNTQGVLREFVPPSSSEQDALTIRNSCEQYCSVKETCWGCSVHCGVGIPCQWNAISECGAVKDGKGIIEGDITQKQGIILVIHSSLLKSVHKLIHIYTCTIPRQISYRYNNHRYRFYNNSCS